MMTDGNTYEINRHLNDQEDYDALQEVTTELEQAEARIEELEDILAVKRKRILTIESDKIDLAFKLAKALAELERLGFDFESIVGRKLKGQGDDL